MNLSRLPIRVRDGSIQPGFLADADHGWLEALVRLASAHVGAPWRELEAALKRPVMDGVPRQRQGLAASVLSRRFRKRVQAARPPARVRAVVFGVAAAGGHRDGVMASAAEALGIDAAAVEQALFADLPSERVVVSPGVMPSAADLAVDANLEMCRSLLMRATEVEIQLAGDTHPLVRRAQRAGLVSILSAGAPGALCLRMSGPLRLFRRTTRYGHALGALLPALARCARFDLVATLAVGEREVELRLRTGDPFLPPGAAAEGRRAVHLARLLASDEWLAIADPEPIGVGARLLFPDVELISRGGQSSWVIECVGFWTPEYLDEKRAVYAAAGVTRLILSVDARLQCGEGEVPPGAPVVLHSGRVVVEDIWRIIEG